MKPLATIAVCTFAGVAVYALAILVSVTGGNGIAQTPKNSEGSTQGSTELQAANWLVCDFGGPATPGEFSHSTLQWRYTEKDFKFDLKRTTAARRLIFVFNNEKTMVRVFDIGPGRELKLSKSLPDFQVRSEAAPRFSLLMTGNAEPGLLGGAHYTFLVSYQRVPDGRFVAIFQAVMASRGPFAGTVAGACSASADQPLKDQIEHARAGWLAIKN